MSYFSPNNIIRLYL